MQLLQHFGGGLPHIRHAHAKFAQRRIAPLVLLHLRHFSAALPHFCRHKMTLQRIHGNFPPAISADKLQNLL